MDGKDEGWSRVKEPQPAAVSGWGEGGFCCPKHIFNYWHTVAFSLFPQCGAQTGDNFTVCNRLTK